MLQLQYNIKENIKLKKQWDKLSFGYKDRFWNLLYFWDIVTEVFIKEEWEPKFVEWNFVFHWCNSCKTIELCRLTERNGELDFDVNFPIRFQDVCLHNSTITTYDLKKVF